MKRNQLILIAAGGSLALLLTWRRLRARRDNPACGTGAVLRAAPAAARCATTVPRRSGTTKPSLASCSYAYSTVLRATPSSPASVRVATSRVPGASVPSRMAQRRHSCSRRWRGQLWWPCSRSKLDSSSA